MGRPARSESSVRLSIAQHRRRHLGQHFPSQGMQPVVRMIPHIPHVCFVHLARDASGHIRQRLGSKE